MRYVHPLIDGAPGAGSRLGMTDRNIRATLGVMGPAPVEFRACFTAVTVPRGTEPGP